jgi:hypothetical protein
LTLTERRDFRVLKRPTFVGDFTNIFGFLCYNLKKVHNNDTIILMILVELKGEKDDGKEKVYD